MLTYQNHVKMIRFKWAMQVSTLYAVYSVVIATALSQECRQVFTASQGYIESPGFPNPNTEQIDCLWEIRGSPGSQIYISFLSVDIAEDERALCSNLGERDPCCSSNWLKIGGPHDESALLICGHGVQPRQYTSSGRILLVKFHTASSATGHGFRLYYSMYPFDDNLPVQTIPSCRANETTCYPKSFECHPKCDHVMHCPNGLDEMGCVKGCQGRIMCESWNGCYTPEERCNGVAQCGDHSDERNCSPDLCTTERGGFLCYNLQCIRENWECDQTNDCGDNSDEVNCLKNSVITAAVMGSLICGLLLVVAVGCTCKLYALRYSESGSSRSTLALSPLEREILRREPPPPYSIAVSQTPTAANYFQQVSSTHHQAPHLMDPYCFARLCRGSHYRRSRRARRQRRRAPSPPSCLVMLPPDVTGAGGLVPTADALAGTAASGTSGGLYIPPEGSVVVSGTDGHCVVIDKIPVLVPELPGVPPLHHPPTAVTSDLTTSVDSTPILFTETLTHNDDDHLPLIQDG